jgi:serine phosphatase RsbU (regulator of sigma subunit)
MSDTTYSKVRSENQLSPRYNSSTNTENTRLVKRIRAATFIVPFLIGALMIVSFFILQSFLSKQHDDATVINISGRQCMLSQRIAKHSVYMTITRGEDKVRHIDSLNESIALFKESHQNLTKKNNTLGFSHNYQLSDDIKNLYDSLDPFYQELIKGADDLLASNSLPDSAERAEKLSVDFDRVERNERSFLPIMDAIVFAYDQENQAKIARLQWIQGSVAFLVILFAISLAAFGLRPMVSKVKQAFIDVEEASQELATQNEELQSSEEEIRQNAEELSAINDSLFILQRKSEEKQLLLNHTEEIAQMGSFNLDLENNDYSYSENLIVIFGLESSKMTNPKHHLKYIHQDEKRKIEHLFIKLIQGKRDSISETIRFKGDKHTEWKFLKLDLYLLRGFDKAPFHIVGVIQDITETEINKQLVEKSQTQLQEQQQLLQDAEKMAKIGSYIWNIKTKSVKNSENLPIIYGFSKEHTVDRETFVQIIHPKDWENNRVALKKAVSQQKDYLLVTYRARNNENHEWKHYKSFSFLKYDENKKLTALVGTVQDMTEEVLENRKMEILLDTVSDNKKYLDEAQNLAKIVSYDIDIYSEQIKWSESFAVVFDILPQDVPTNTDDFQAWINEENLEKSNEGWAKAIINKTEFDEIYCINTPQGRIFYIRERGYPVFDSTGSLISMRGTLQDVTKTQLAQKEIKRKSQMIEKQNTKFISSVNYAQRIQSAMLGGTQNLKTIFKDGFVFFEPKDIVSGDFYWYAEQGTRKIAIVGDCTGHGVPGAFMSLLGATILNDIIRKRQITTPSTILDELQKEIEKILNQENTGNRDGMDMAIVVLDESVGMLEFAGAKNPLVYIHKKRKKGGADANLTVIKGDNLSIGGRKGRTEAKYTNHVIDLKHVGAFYLYSDGYQDQFGGENGGKFLSTKFRQLLYDTHSTSMRHQRVSLKRTLMNWTGTENDQIDDICVMGVTV